MDLINGIENEEDEGIGVLKIKLGNWN